jgi:hypothetical protein
MNPWRNSEAAPPAPVDDEILLAQLAPGRNGFRTIGDHQRKHEMGMGQVSYEDHVGEETFSYTSYFRLGYQGFDLQPDG